MDDLFCFHVSALTPRTPDTPNLFGGDLGNQVSKQPRYPQTTQHKYIISMSTTLLTPINPMTASREEMRSWISSAARALATHLHGAPTLVSLREVMKSVGFVSLSEVIADGTMDKLRLCTANLVGAAIAAGLYNDEDTSDVDELPAPPAEIPSPDDVNSDPEDAMDALDQLAADLARQIAEVRAKKAATPPPVAGLSEVDRERIDHLESRVTNVEDNQVAHGVRLDSVESRLAPLAAVLDALSPKTGTAPAPLPPAALAAAKAAVSGDRLLIEVLPFFTPGVDQGNQIPCVASPPSFGKTFMSDEISRLYDGSFFHPFKDSLDEIDSLVGTLMPRSDGTFAVIDGPLVSAARLASTGVNVLFVGDEIFNASKKTLEWMQSFLSPRLVEVIDADGVATLKRCFVIQTKHSLEDGTFEVIKAPEERLHFLFLGNLRTNPPEALMSRCRLMRFDFDIEWAQLTAEQRLVSYSGGVWSGPDAKAWAAQWAKAMADSREAYSRMEVSRPLCFRFLIGAITHVIRQPSASLKMLTGYILKWAPHQIAVQNAATQDTDPTSRSRVISIVTGAFGV